LRASTRWIYVAEGKKKKKKKIKETKQYACDGEEERRFKIRLEKKEILNQLCRIGRSKRDAR